MMMTVSPIGVLCVHIFSHIFSVIVCQRKIKHVTYSPHVRISFDIVLTLKESNMLGRTQQHEIVVTIIIS